MTTPLYVRSGYSMGRGTTMPQRLIERAAAMGYAQIALTDVNGLYGLPPFYKQAQGAGLHDRTGGSAAEEARPGAGGNGR